MDYRENEEQTMIRQMVRKFVANEVKPAAMEFDHQADPKDCIPWDLLRKAAKLGLTKMSIPAEYRGGGVKDLMSLMATVEELGAGDNGFAGTIRDAIGLTAWMDVLCNQQQKDEFFPKIVADDCFLIAEGMTEPNSGTDNTLMASVPGGAMQTYAEKRGDEYVINGSKHFHFQRRHCQADLASCKNRQKAAAQSMPQRLPGAIGHAGPYHRKIPQQARAAAHQQRAAVF